jgi:hypothetical protein
MNVTGRTPVLLLDSNGQRRNRVAASLRARGFLVSTATTIAEIERWPVGQIVVVDATCFTPLWTTVGAAHVVVLSDVDPAPLPGEGPCTRIAGEAVPDALISVLEALQPDTVSDLSPVTSPASKSPGMQPTTA